MLLRAIRGHTQLMIDGVGPFLHEIGIWSLGSLLHLLHQGREKAVRDC